MCHSVLYHTIPYHTSPHYGLQLLSTIVVAYYGQQLQRKLCNIAPHCTSTLEYAARHGRLAGPGHSRSITGIWSTTHERYARGPGLAARTGRTTRRAEPTSGTSRRRCKHTRECTTALPRSLAIRAGICRQRAAANAPVQTCPGSPWTLAADTGGQTPLRHAPQTRPHARRLCMGAVENTRNAERQNAVGRGAVAARPVENTRRTHRRHRRNREQNSAV